MTPEERYTENVYLVDYVFCRTYPNLIANEDLQQEGKLGLWRACLAFDESQRGAFSTLAVPYIRNAISNGYQKLYGRSIDRRCFFWNMDSLQQLVGDPEDQSPLIDIVAGESTIGFLDVSGMLSKMTAREIDILQRWVWGETRDEIAEDLSISKPTIWRALDKVKKLYIEYI